jgi:hypothetical protein
MLLASPPVPLVVPPSPPEVTPAAALEPERPPFVKVVPPCAPPLRPPEASSSEYREGVEHAATTAHSVTPLQAYEKACFIRYSVCSVAIANEDAGTSVAV